MSVVLLVTRQDHWPKYVEATIPGASVFVAGDETEALQKLRTVAIDVAIWAREHSDDAEPFIEGVRRVAPECVVIAVVDKNIDEELADFVLRTTDTSKQVDAVFGRALEKSRLLQELAALRSRSLHRSIESVTRNEPPVESPKSLRDFTRILAVGFDLPRTLER